MYAQIPAIPRAMKILLIAYVVTFVVVGIAEKALGWPIVFYLGFVPEFALKKGFVWQLVTYSFLHGNLAHLLWNGFAMWMLGTELMRLWGTREFFKFYGVCVIGGALTKLLATYVLFPLMMGEDVASQTALIPMVGASGALYGLLAAYAIFFGEQVMYIMFLFPMKAKHVAVLLGLISLWQMLVEQEGGLVGGVAHSAHLGGMVAGFLYLYFKTKRKLYSRRKETQERDKLKTRFRVIVNQNFGRENEEKDPPSDPSRWN